MGIINRQLTVTVAGSALTSASAPFDYSISPALGIRGMPSLSPDTLYEGTVYIDKKITRIRGISAACSRITSSDGLSFSLYNGYDIVMEEEPVSLVWGAGDFYSTLRRKYLFSFDGEQGLVNREGFITVRMKYLPVTGIYNPPYYAPVNESLPVDAVSNPVVFKSPFDVNFRIECEI